MALSCAKKKVLSGSSTVDLVNTCLEMYSRTLAITKVICAYVLKEGVVKLAKIKEELSASTRSLKEARDANVALGEALRAVELNFKKVDQERDALRAYYKGVKKTNEKLSGNIRELEQSLFEATLAHDEVVSEKALMGIELNKLKDYVIDLHKETFGQAVRQAVFLYDVPKQNNMDPNKDVFNGRLVPIKEVLAAEDPTPNDGKGGDNQEEREEDEEGDDRVDGEE